MSSTRNAASRPRSGRGAAARSVTFHGLKVPVPTKIPGTLAFDLAALEETEGDDNKSGFAELVKMLETLLGHEQVEKVKAQVASRGISLDDVTGELMGLIGKIIDAAGSSTGK